MPTKKYRIFAIDDESDILELFKDLLSEDYELSTFLDPQSFLRYFDKVDAVHPDLVITDLNLPAMSGIEMIKQIQKRGGKFPFILLSGFLNKDNVIQAVDLGVFRMLEKPVDSDILLATIDQLILENQIISVRKEIRQITSQLRELYTGIRLIMEQYIPEGVMKKMIVEAPDGVVKTQMSFDQLLESLESRLETLLQSENILTDIKVNQFKTEKN